MIARTAVTAACVVLFSMASQSHVQAKQHATWDAYMKANRYACPGPLDTLNKSRTLKLGGKTYQHTGSELRITNPDADHNVNIGVITAIKDTAPGTKANIKEALHWFKSAGVDWVIVNGDLALEEFDLEEVMELLGRSKLPTLLLIGNSESRGSWARTYRSRALKYPNLINGVWVRRIIADDVEFWTLPGYHDKAFVRQGAGCVYKPSDLEEMSATFKASGKGPIVLVSHGPPRGEGAQAIDLIYDKKNVGDANINTLIEEAQIPFGLFGHILEAGGRAVGKNMRTRVAQNTWTSHLYLNAGSLSGDPWKLLDGKLVHGMAILVSIKQNEAKYEVKLMKSSKHKD